MKTTSTVEDLLSLKPADKDQCIRGRNLKILVETRVN